MKTMRMTAWTAVAAALLAAPLLAAAARAEGGGRGESRGGDDPIRIVATLGVVGDLARAVGGDRVVVEVLCDPRQDPHYVQPRPTLMSRARRADLLIEVGLQLELWAQKIADGSGNPRIQIGQPGRLIASQGVRTMELPTVLSREWGDIHPYGNPHIWLDPVRARKMAGNIAASLVALDPEHAAGYRERLGTFQERLDRSLFGKELLDAVGSRRLTRLAESGRLMTYLEDHDLTAKLGGWLARGAALRGKSIVTYHKTWIYFARRFGMTIPIEIEEKPGIPPSARHRDRVVKVMRGAGVKAIVEALFYDRTAADFVASKTGAKVVSVPIDVGEEGGAPTYFDLMDLLIERITAAVGEGS